MPNACARHPRSVSVAASCSRCTRRALALRTRRPRAMATIRACLAALGVTSAETFGGCVDAGEEFSAVKKLYFRLALASHPDKGGDEARFREVQEAWEALRQLYDSGKVHASGFSFYLGGAGAAAKAAPPSGRTGQPTPSYEWFADAAEEAVPSYKVELAKSGRSQCKATGAACKHGEDPVIAQGAVRFGSMDMEAGAYGRWRHLSCWRVPASIWLGLPDPEETSRAAFEAAIVQQQQVSFCGYTELPEAEQQAVVDYIMDKSNWARRTKNSKAAGAGGAGAGAGAGGEEADDAGAPGHVPLPAPPSKALVTQGGPGGAFVVPRPGMNGAVADALGGKTFVMTGIFPELGGGAGLDLGKDRCKAMILAFGGKVTGSVSGKTDYLVVGKAPGASKVSQAIAKGVPTLDIAGLKAVLEGPGASLADAPAAHISGFSAGYKGNALRLTAGAATALAIKAAKVPKVPKPKPAPAKSKKSKREEEEDEEDEEEEDEEDEPIAKKAKKAPAGKKKGKKAAESEDEEADDEEAAYVPRASRSRAKRA